MWNVTPNGFQESLLEYIQYSKENSAETLGAMLLDTLLNSVSKAANLTATFIFHDSDWLYIPRVEIRKTVGY